MEKADSRGVRPNRMKQRLTWRIAEWANESVENLKKYTFPAVLSSRLPLTTIFNDVDTDQGRRMRGYLKNRFAWMSTVDIALAWCRVREENKELEGGEGMLVGSAAGIFALIQSNVETIYHLVEEGFQDGRLSLFSFEILARLDPMTLNVFDKYLLWKGHLESNTTEPVWEILCKRYGMDTSKNILSPEEVEIPWKAYFIMTFFQRCQLMPEGKQEADQLLICLALMMDNGPLLEEYGLISFNP